nr:LuxR C-terminal-related transcriptional regulator [Kordiimonas marina]
MEKAETSHEVWQLLLDYITERGFKAASYGYGYMSPRSTVEEVETGDTVSLKAALSGRTWITTLPKEAVQEYLARNYQNIHPMLHQIETHSMQPLYMAREILDPNDPNYADYDHLLARAAHYGIRSAIGFPLYHPLSRSHGEVSFHCAEPIDRLREIMAEYGNQVHLAALYMHTFYQPLERRERAAKVGIKGRPLEVLEQLYAGYTNSQIADRMGVSAPTVSFHIKELREALAVSSTREILPMALRLGLLHE